MNIKYIKLSNADFNLVEIKNNKPYCKLHGAMNKLTSNGIWRCVSTYKKEQLNDNGKGYKSKFIENNCKAGCEECKK